MINKSIYLDYAATTPVDPRVAQKMMAHLTAQGNFGNPASTTHAYGWSAAQAIEQASIQVAQSLNIEPRELIWTSGATEANNLALKGIADFYQRKGRHIITSKIEHKSVLDSCRQLEKCGFEVSYLAPNASGIIEVNDIAAAIRADTILISIMQVNNETGIIQNIKGIGTLARQHNIFFHVDAAQSVGKLAIDLVTLPVDLMSLSAHKVYGPKGIGALYLRRNPPIKLTPQIHGGGQQGGMRAGTLPTHQIVGMGEAFALMQQQLASDLQQATLLKQRLWQGLQEIADVQMLGAMEHTVPHILNISFNGVANEALLTSLNNLALASGSACDSATMEPSYVLRAMGYTKAVAQGAVRISLGRFTTMQEIDAAVGVIKQEVKRLRGDLGTFSV